MMPWSDARASLNRVGLNNFRSHQEARMTHSCKKRELMQPSGETIKKKNTTKDIINKSFLVLKKKK